MIDIRSDGTKLKVILSPSLGDGKSAYLYWECGTDWYAQLLAERCHKRLTDKLEEIRREAYESGWKDAKAKRRKRTWFAFWWGG